MKQLAEPFMGFLLLFLVFLVSRYGTEQVLSEQALAGLKQPKQPVVVVDAGHGGNDPGKVAVNGSLEKDINLAIAKRLAWYLEQADVTVIMTRDSDSGLYSQNDSRKKTSDMQKRCQIMNESKADLAVSIHQNSFPDASVSGPQVFYFEQSAESSAIASVMQDTLNNSLNPPKPRVCKSNNDYYILKKTPTPIIIVECGFLSNETEAALLVTDAYQEKLVRAVYLGAITYLESGKDVPDTAT